MKVPGLFVCFLFYLPQKLARKLRFWRKTGSCFLVIRLSTRTLMDKKATQQMWPRKRSHLPVYFFSPLVQKTAKFFSFYWAPPANTELPFTIDPPWCRQNVGKLLCYSLYDSRRPQNRPVVSRKCLLCRIKPRHSCSDGSNSLHKVSTRDWLSWVTWWHEQERTGILHHVQTKVKVFWWHGVSVSEVNMLQWEWVNRKVRNRLSLTGWQQFSSWLSV